MRETFNSSLRDIQIVLAVIQLTFPSRTFIGRRLDGVQCAAVKIKYSEIIVPPQSKLLSSVSKPRAAFCKKKNYLSFLLKIERRNQEYKIRIGIIPSMEIHPNQQNYHPKFSMQCRCLAPVLNTIHTLEDEEKK